MLICNKSSEAFSMDFCASVCSYTSFGCWMCEGYHGSATSGTFTLSQSSLNHKTKNWYKYDERSFQKKPEGQEILNITCNAIFILEAMEEKSFYPLKSLRVSDCFFII